MPPEVGRPAGPGPDGLAINNTFIRRTLTLLGLRTTARFFRRHGACILISKHLIVKSDKFVDLTEAATIDFVAKNTSIPVPKVWCSFVHNGRAYIVMEKIQGDGFTEDWTTRSRESKDRLLGQLKAMMQQLRSLQPPPGAGVQSCIGGSLFDSRMPRPDVRFGPFSTVNEFHLWLRDGLQPSEMEKPENVSPEEFEDVKDMVARQDGSWPPLVFTHGDLHAGNIIVRGDEVVGIIDWEFSGWYPNYWEYTSAWFTQSLNTTWQELLSSFLEPFPEELEMERTRQRWWGEV